MAAPAEIPFSELINKPKDAVAKLKAAPDGRLRLRRRDDEDLILTTVAREEDNAKKEFVATQILEVLLLRHAETRGMLAEVAQQIFPWMRHLPREDREGFVVELVETMRSTAELNTEAPVEMVIIGWRNTAEIHADPELLAALTRPHEGDFGPVPRPVVPERDE
ncbi:hypothetical protein F4560_006943 [Saccharothrix ecbatanensis]|uniref:Prevent-host-death family protein n=1 Tax=Saccharothrix ecbatanensis TaxID=1105145 RepID=A0A7W9M4J4_9PSEU|nr:hypothetical protein [Saccharothrix ecbatanensis]MBB5807175.1 hypothetical protein [Saccharothrix ecbatanensis]